jgi:hypothetical protein
VTAPVVFGQDPVGTFTGRFDVWIEGSIASRCPGAQLSPPLRLTVDLHGEDGFMDRVMFELPMNCQPAGGLALVRPNEVDPMSLRVSKAGLGQDNLDVSWASSPDAGAYNVWEGDLALLHRGVYSHVVPNLPQALVQRYCDVLTATTTLFGAAELGVPNHYYLVTADGQPTCAATASLDGPAGYPDANADTIPDADEIPAGHRLSSFCQ